LQFSCHAPRDWKISAFQAFPQFIAVQNALFGRALAKRLPQLGAKHPQHPQGAKPLT